MFQLQRESLSAEERQSVREHLGHHGDSLLSVQITGRKPNFEVGSSSQLKLSVAKKSAPSGKTGHLPSEQARKGTVRNWAGEERRVSRPPMSAPSRLFLL